MMHLIHRNRFAVSLGEMRSAAVPLPQRGKAYCGCPYR